MAIKTLYIDNFISQSNGNVVIDVRSPSEYQHAHFPGAISIPLFDDEERKVVGTTYKQKSRESAIKIGLDFFGPKMRGIVEQVEEIMQKAHSKTIFIHCWRGGMRSGAIAWLLDLYGFDVHLLKGGYKAYRNWVLAQFVKKYNLIILSGYTGSGKTEILHEFERMGEAVIDLEALAAHKGSTFGALGQGSQPSTEYFENLLALKLYELTKEDEERLIWVESESNRLGIDLVNFQFHQQMKEATCIHIEVPKEARINKIVEEYGVFDKDELMAGVDRISKRLGGLSTKQAKEFIAKEDFYDAFEILINYYDKAYDASKLFQPPILDIHLEGTDADVNAGIVLEQIRKTK